jgi:putative transposase
MVLQTPTIVGDQAMDGSIRLSAGDRKALLHLVRCGHDQRQARHAHVLLLLAEGWSVRRIGEALFASADLICAVRQRFACGGLRAALEPQAQAATVPWWHLLLQCWLLRQTPRDFGYFRTRWSCAILAELLQEEHQVCLSRESVRRAVHALGFVWRRPRPVVGPKDPHHRAKMRRIRRLITQLPPDEVAVFQDEVQIDLNPKLGSAWMRRGQQAEVVTPGDNEQRHIAASLVVQTGRLLVSPAGRRRNTDLFLAHLEDLCRRLRAWRRIHVICDNAAFHKNRRVQAWLAARAGRVQLHYLPSRAPEENRIERVFWRLHETATRNHRCQSMTELLDEVYAWCEKQYFFPSVSDYAIAA